MNEIKSLIDDAMEDIVVDEEAMEQFVSKRLTVYKKRRRNKKIFLIAFLLLSCTIPVAAKGFYNWQINVNDEKTLVLDEIKAISVNESVDKNEDLETSFSTVRALENFLGIHFLQSSYAADDQFVRIRYQNMGSGYHAVYISAYITGDIQNIVIDDTTNKDGVSYSWDAGDLYKKPFDLEILFVTDKEHKNFGFDYLGIYKLVEQYQSAQGYTVNILKKGDSVYENDIQEYLAVFVADGMYYELSGITTRDELLKIIDSFK